MFSNYDDISFASIGIISLNNYTYKTLRITIIREIRVDQKDFIANLTQH